MKVLDVHVEVNVLLPSYLTEYSEGERSRSQRGTVHIPENKNQLSPLKTRVSSQPA